jgi:hypothetical protein
MNTQAASLAHHQSLWMGLMPLGLVRQWSMSLGSV